MTKVHKTQISPKGKKRKMRLTQNSMFTASDKRSEDLSMDRRRIFDGTSERELIKAMSTFMNMTGAGDYNLPNLTGSKQAQSGKRAGPEWSFKKKTKLSWFPQRYVNFQGSSSPPATLYSPKTDKPFKN